MDRERRQRKSNDTGSDYSRLSSSGDLLQRTEYLALKVQKLTDGEDPLDDATHAKIAQRLRELYHIVVSIRPAPALTASARFSLIASGVALGRGAVSGRGRRDEITRTSALVAIVSLADGFPPGVPDQGPSRASSDSKSTTITYAKDLRLPVQGQSAHGGGEEDGGSLTNDLERSAHQLACIAHESRLVDTELLDRCAADYWMHCVHAMRGQMLENTQSVRSIEARPLREIIHDQYATSLVEAADAELGQIVFRDLILSFRLPCAVMGQRRTIVLERGQTQQAEQHHADALNRAHSAAMQSPSDVWLRGPIVPQVTESTSDVVGDFLRPESSSLPRPQHEQTPVTAGDGFKVDDHDDTESVERTCVLLSAIAMNLSTSADAARTGDAFGGRVELPFLSTRGADTLTRIALHKGEWFYYRVSTRRLPTGRSNSPLEVLVRGPGLSGLLACAMAMLAD